MNINDKSYIARRVDAEISDLLTYIDEREDGLNNRIDNKLSRIEKNEDSRIDDFEKLREKIEKRFVGLRMEMNDDFAKVEKNYFAQIKVLDINNPDYEDKVEIIFRNIDNDLMVCNNKNTKTIEDLSIKFEKKMDDIFLGKEMPIYHINNESREIQKGVSFEM